MTDRSDVTEPGSPTLQVCEETQIWLAGNLAGSAEPMPDAVDAHLAECQRCHAEAAESRRLWQQLDELATPVPSGELRRRFDATLAAYREGLAGVVTDPAGRPAVGAETEPAGAAPARPPLPFRQRLRRRPLRYALRLGYAAATLLAGVGIGMLLARPAAPPESMTALQDEMRGLREVLALSLLQQGSASARLEGVSLGAGLAGRDPEVLAALLDTLATDPSPNVRLAAVDALAGRAADPAVQRRLGEVLRREPSPLVQIALADALLAADGRGARHLVAPLATSREVRPEVREFVRQRLGNRT
jgi:hypothetical protein